jgi:protein-L-isoaspartate(D-aspartate) O-methyltransferase
VIFDRGSGQRGLAAAGSAYARPPDERWQPVPEALDRAIAGDRRLAEAGVAARKQLLQKVLVRLAGLAGPAELASFAAALMAVPRERFVLPEEIASSAEDAPSPLDAEGLATVSAPHAYALTYFLLGLGEGDHLIELGTGTGYGAALASYMVGRGGAVTSIEIDPVLVSRAARLLAEPTSRGPAPVTTLTGDAKALGADALAAAVAGGRPVRVAYTYALPAPPDAILALLPEEGRLVAPVAQPAARPGAGVDAGEDDQTLVRWDRVRGALRMSGHGAVRYVPERS